jgi:hypothetical protein
MSDRQLDAQGQRTVRTGRFVVATVLMLGMTTSAAWAASVSGQSAAGAEVASVTVNQTSRVLALTPGGDARKLFGNFDNPNSAQITISSVTAEVTGVQEAAEVTGACDPADFTVTGTGSAGAVPAGNSQGSWSGLSLSLTNSSANQDACKNAVVLLTYTVT